MSDKTFEWTDELVAEFGEYYRKKQGVDYSTWGKCILDAFKESKEKDVHKDYEVLEGALMPGFSKKKHINSVKRLSDNQVYSLGDYAKVKANNGDITNFVINGFVEENGIIMVLVKNSGCRFSLSMLQPKEKVPLFTTEDGVEVFPNQKVYGVNADFKYTNSYYWADGSFGKYSLARGVLYFSTEEKAQEYILLNKPIQVTYQEMLNQFKGGYASTLVVLEKFFKAKINP